MKQRLKILFMERSKMSSLHDQRENLLHPFIPNSFASSSPVRPQPKPSGPKSSSLEFSSLISSSLQSSSLDSYVPNSARPLPCQPKSSSHHSCSPISSSCHLSPQLNPSSLSPSNPSPSSIIPSSHQNDSDGVFPTHNDLTSSCPPTDFTSSTFISSQLRPPRSYLSYQRRQRPISNCLKLNPPASSSFYASHSSKTPQSSPSRFGFHSPR